MFIRIQGILQRIMTLAEIPGQARDDAGWCVYRIQTSPPIGGCVRQAFIVFRLSFIVDSIVN
jgi:hypothetical protein